MQMVWFCLFSLSETSQHHIDDEEAVLRAEKKSSLHLKVYSRSCDYLSTHTPQGQEVDFPSNTSLSSISGVKGQAEANGM